MASVLSLSNVEDVRIKWPLALFAFFVGLILGLIWFWYLKRNRWLYKAVKELCSIFQSDVNKLIKQHSDLHLMNLQQKTLILVDALNLLKNLSVRTFTVGGIFMNNEKVL